MVCFGFCLLKINYKLIVLLSNIAPFFASQIFQFINHNHF
ncbi:hypothetical protein QN326_06680 [Candidatus Phytoplasma asteris]|uniref:Uncharacterized protein n=1 Tax=Candidatus Phytoplasma asteris TaxID=85620 RepID=A0ABZ3CFG4_9MOLU